jgi:hypothetical protein
MLVTAEMAQADGRGLGTKESSVTQIVKMGSGGGCFIGPAAQRWHSKESNPIVNTTSRVRDHIRLKSSPDTPFWGIFD